MATVLIDDLNFPEGPAFDHNDGIWLVEKEAGNLIYYKDNMHQRFHVGGHPNGIAIDSKGTLWFCDSKQNAIRQYDPNLKTHRTIIDCIADKPLKMPNDLCFDHNDNLIFTCPGDRLDDDTGYICALYTDGTLSVIHSGMFYPNGLAFASDNNSLYIAETGSKWIWKGNWNAKNKQLDGFKKFAFVGGSVGPDGIAFDDTGNLYVAIYGEHKIAIVDITGIIIGEITLQHPNPTNCAIDPKGTQGLIITEAKKGQLLQIKNNKKGLL